MDTEKYRYLVFFRVTERGDIRVQYDGCNNRWTFHPGALTKVDVFDVGDIVYVSSDINAVKELQRGNKADRHKSRAHTK